MQTGDLNRATIEQTHPSDRILIRRRIFERVIKSEGIERNFARRFRGNDGWKYGGDFYGPIEWRRGGSGTTSRLLGSNLEDASIGLSVRSVVRLSAGCIENVS